MIKKLKIDKDNEITVDIRSIHTIQGPSYFIEISNETAETFIFTMISNQRGGWRIVNAPQVPEWVLQLEGSLSVLIEEEDIFD